MSALRIAVQGHLNCLGREALSRLTDRRMEPDENVRAVVSDIIARVRREGDAALRDLARTLDGANLSELEVPREAWRDALGRLAPETRSALTRAAGNIARAHSA
ncbi:MAG: histidinol dehydrogenase, partial [Gemmatimonadaceae bacterium]